MKCPKCGAKKKNEVTGDIRDKRVRTCPSCGHVFLVAPKEGRP